MVSDGGGAVVIASPEVVRNTRKKPVWIIGCGEATKYRENNGDITVSAGAQAAPLAFGEAGVNPTEIDVLMAYDSFSITVMCLIEDLGFCKKGEGGAFVQNGRIGLGGELPVNTDGGGLSSNHPGMRGIFLVIEAVKQLRGECGARQVKDCEIALCHGTGGMLGLRHSGVTLILGRA